MILNILHAKCFALPIVDFKYLNRCNVLSSLRKVDFSDIEKKWTIAVIL